MQRATASATKMLLKTAESTGWKIEGLDEASQEIPESSCQQKASQLGRSSCRRSRNMALWRICMRALFVASVSTSVGGSLHAFSYYIRGSLAGAFAVLWWQSSRFFVLFSRFFGGSICCALVAVFGTFQRSILSCVTGVFALLFTVVFVVVWREYACTSFVDVFTVLLWKSSRLLVLGIEFQCSQQTGVLIALLTRRFICCQNAVT